VVEGRVVVVERVRNEAGELVWDARAEEDEDEIGQITASFSPTGCEVRVLIGEGDKPWTMGCARTFCDEFCNLKVLWFGESARYWCECEGAPEPQTSS
jgi:hypothetical protein